MTVYALNTATNERQAIPFPTVEKALEFCLTMSRLNGVPFAVMDADEFITHIAYEGVIWVPAAEKATEPLVATE